MGCSVPLVGSVGWMAKARPCPRRLEVQRLQGQNTERCCLLGIFFLIVSPHAGAVSVWRFHPTGETLGSTLRLPSCPLHRPGAYTLLPALFIPPSFPTLSYIITSFLPFCRRMPCLLERCLVASSPLTCVFKVIGAAHHISKSSSRLTSFFIDAGWGLGILFGSDWTRGCCRRAASQL
jgi:hypothetical protein